MKWVLGLISLSSWAVGLIRLRQSKKTEHMARVSSAGSPPARLALVREPALGREGEARWEGEGLGKASPNSEGHPAVLMLAYVSQVCWSTQMWFSWHDISSLALCLLHHLWQALKKCFPSGLREGAWNNSNFWIHLGLIHWHDLGWWEGRSNPKLLLPAFLGD